ncbi:MAG: FkbM family methyltransferase [Flavobacteriales bacterium]
MRITKALYHLFEHAYRLGWRRAIHVIRLKRSPKGGLRSIEAPWLGGRVFVRPGTADMATIDQFLIGPYMPATTGAPPLTVLDCGANIGLAARYLKHAYPDAVIVAIEPDEENHQLLKRNLEGLAGCHAVKAAVWPTDGRVSLQREGLRHSAFRTKEATGSDDTIEALSIPTIMQRFGMQRIGLLKVDIEGAEQELFGANDLSWLVRVDRVAVELHDLFKPGCGDAFFKAMATDTWTYRFYGEVVFCERMKRTEARP